MVGSRKIRQACSIAASAAVSVSSSRAARPITRSLHWRSRLVRLRAGAGSVLHFLMTFPWADAPVWGFIGVVVGIVAGATGVWAAFRAAADKCRLLYWMWEVIPRPTTPEGFVDTGLPGRDGYTEKPLARSHLVKICLLARGRRNVQDGDFQGQPLILDVGKPIVKMESATVYPGSRPAPWVAVGNRTIRVGPCVLPHGHVLVIEVLVNSPEPRLTCQTSSLGNVDLREHIPGVRSSMMAALVASLAAPATGLGAGLLAAIALSSLLAGKLVAAERDLLEAVLLAVVSGVAWWQASRFFTRRRRRGGPTPFPRFGRRR